MTPGSTSPSRRVVLQRLFALAALSATNGFLVGCGGGDAMPAPVIDPPPPPLPPPPQLPPPPPTTPALKRLKEALQRASLPTAAASITVTQGLANSIASSLGSNAIIYPPLDAPDQSLATIPQVWGRGRTLWNELGGAVIDGHSVRPVQRAHHAATLNSVGVCGLHFEFDGPAFEMLFAGTNAAITLIADGRYMAPKLIQTTLDSGVAGAPLTVPNTFVRFDFGTRATRRISVYASSSQGPCAVAISAGDTLQPWDRSDEASFAAITDSYGGANGPNWRGGPFWEAAALLGMAHMDLDAIGGTGYAPNAANADGLNPGNAFLARLATSVDAKPDLLFTAGGLNDNNSLAAPPYATADEARDGFAAAVMRYYRELRTALPDAVLVTTGPWAPRQSTPTHPIAQSKADVIKSALLAAGRPWVFLDNLNGGWINSAGARELADAAHGPWQTGTGNTATTAGDGNGDLYLAADGIHPNEAGCLYLGARMATDLRAALQSM